MENSELSLENSENIKNDKYFPKKVCVENNEIGLENSEIELENNDFCLEIVNS